MSRTPAGSPAGGRFASRGGAAPDVALGTVFDPEPHRHRNGVSGWPFECRFDESAGGERSRSVVVSFDGRFEGSNAAGEDVYGPPTVIKVPLEAIRLGAMIEPEDSSGFAVRAVVADRFGLVVFDTAVDDGDRRTMVAVVDTGADDGDYRTAVFDVRKLLDGDLRFGSNSWRGDRYHADALRALRARSGDVPVV